MIAAIFIGLLFILADRKPMGKGLILGTIFSVLNFILMGETLPMKLGKAPKKTVVWALGSIFFRYILLAAPLILAVKLNQFHLVTVICGIFMVQLMIVFDHFLIFFRSKNDKQV